MPQRRKPQIAQQTHSRRSVLEWLGRATVVALGSDLLVACSAAENQSLRDGGRGDLAEQHQDLLQRDGARRDEAVQDALVGGDGFAPGAGDLPIYGSWPERTVDPQDLSAILASWRLSIGGMVQNELSFSFSELLDLQRRDQLTDFHCVEGWSVYDVPWNGISLAALLDKAQPDPRASYLSVFTIGRRYNESLPLTVAREDKTLLAFGVGGASLPLAHGFPLRLVVPRLLGYKNAKYVERLELTDSPLEGYWVKVGYPYAGEVPPGRLRPGKY